MHSFLRIAGFSFLVLASMPIQAQFVILEKPKIQACRYIASSAGVFTKCLQGVEGLEDFSHDKAEIVEKIQRIHANSSEEDVRRILGNQPRVIKPTVRLSFGGMHYQSNSISWWALPETELAEEQRVQAGTVEVQFVNGFVTTVWWHRLNSYLHLEHAVLQCVLGCTDAPTHR